MGWFVCWLVGWFVGQVCAGGVLGGGNSMPEDAIHRVYGGFGITGSR